MYILLILLIIVLLTVVILILKKNKPINSSNKSNSIWSGYCMSNLSSSCDPNNNCSVSCNNKVLFANKNVCSDIKTKCDSQGNCNAVCNASPKTNLSCDSDFFGIWNGKCSYVPTISSTNRNVTIKCDNIEIVTKALCDDTNIRGKNGDYVACCKINDQPLPPPPTCDENSTQVWPTSGSQDCPFIQVDSINNESNLYCSGKKVFSGNCSELSTVCNNGKCIGCCVSTPSKQPPTCLFGSEIWRTNNPTTCENINSSCVNGQCIVTCNGNVIYTDNSGYTQISSRCNTVGCVVCAI